MVSFFLLPFPSSIVYPFFLRCFLTYPLSISSISTMPLTTSTCHVFTPPSGILYVHEVLPNFIVYSLKKWAGLLGHILRNWLPITVVFQVHQPCHCAGTPVCVHHGVPVLSHCRDLPHVRHPRHHLLRHNHEGTPFKINKNIKPDIHNYHTIFYK